MTEIKPFKSNRIAVVDFLRGFAMLGVIVSNFMAFHSSQIKSTGIDQYLNILEEFAFGPVWIVLSFLFGFGFWSLIQNQNHSPWIFVQRMFWLFLIGIFNACIFHIDILRDFAVVGIFLLFTLYLSNRNFLFLTILLTILIPLLRAYTIGLGFEGNNEINEIEDLLMSNDLTEVIFYNLKFIEIVQIKYTVYLISVHFEMLCFFLWGILANRYSIFEKKKSIAHFSKKLMLISMSGIILIQIIFHFNSLFYVEISHLFNFNICKEILYASFVFSFVTQIYLSGILKKFFNLITIYGRLTLTNYLAQSIISLFLFSGIGLGLGKNQPLWVYFSLAVLVYLLQIIFSFYWSRKFNFGPVEWFWRSLSVRKLLPIKKTD